MVRWLLENGVDIEKSCQHGQKPLDVVGQCRLDAQAEAAIRQALCEKLQRKWPDVTSFCVIEGFYTNHQYLIRLFFLYGGDGGTEAVAKHG